MNTPYGETVESTWYTFDPNVHYYYDEHNQVHYYDPNTNQEISYQPHYYPTSASSSTSLHKPAYTPLSSFTETPSRQPTPDVLIPCPEPTCEGENKPKSKFCEDCGRPLGPISRSVTPAMTPTMNTLTKTYSQHQLQETHYPPIQRPPTAPLYSSSHPYQQPPQLQQHQDIYGTYQKDPLNRARGCPVISFGFGGKIVTTFPRSVTNYYSSTTQAKPGVVYINSLKTLLPSPPQSFPGPLLHDTKIGTKQKKKDILQYIQQKTLDLESTLSSIPTDSVYHPQLQSSLLLWKLMGAFIETEGHINDKDKMDMAILNVLRPAIHLNEDDANFTLPTYTTATAIHEDLSDKILSKIQSLLLQGNRKEAVDYAIQEDLWSHALIISSCVDKDLWQKVVSSFVQREMNATPEMKRNRHYNNIAGNNQSLRVLYALFSGAGGAAINEFYDQSTPPMPTPYGVPPAKPQAQIRDLLKWRDTVAIILANRTNRDQEALTALGDILKTHGWTAAAHICYLLSPQTAIQSGIDTMHVRLTLIGDENPTEESIELTEIYEFGLSLHSNNNTCLPYLQGYKLAHAWILSDYGYLDEAQRYYDAIDECIKTYPKPTNPYLHQCLNDQLSQLGLFLENATGKKPGMDPGSWLKPKFQKKALTSLWGSLEGSFTKFVSGDESSTEEPPSRKSTEIRGRYS